MTKCVSESSLSECESDTSDKEDNTLEGTLDINTFAVVPSEPLPVDESGLGMPAAEHLKAQVIYLLNFSFHRLEQNKQLLIIVGTVLVYNLLIILLIFFLL